MKFFRVFLLSLSFLFLGCQEQKVDEATQLHWDRDMCDRCVMVISDRKNALQLRDPQTKKLYKFDDIGCMALWFKEEKISYKDSVKIWITDAKSGEWIDARAAYYTTQNTTPMAFGYSAYKSKEALGDVEILTYEQVIEKIR